jgi:hypothetical protein
MLSTISGIYFAGHRKPVATAVGPAPPPVAGSGIAISVPGSATNGSTSIVDQGGILATMTAPAPVTVVTSPSPAYMVAPSGMGNYNLQSTISLTPSSQKQGSITMWLYIPSASVGANTGSYAVTYAGPAFDGIYMFGESDSSKNITLKATTNGQSWNNVQTVPAPNYLPRDRWFMLTYVFIMNNTAPSSVWYDDTLVHTWTHPSDNMSGGTYNVAMDMFGSWGGRFNSFRIRDTGYTQAEVTAKFAAERSYYGV